jgi:hypothetical protein
LNPDLVFCWPCIVIHQNSKTKDMYFLYSFYYELTASTYFEHYLFNFRRRYTSSTCCIACVLCLLAAPNLVQPTDITHMQYTKCRLCSAPWRWACSARNMYKLLIHNKLNTNSAYRWSYYADVESRLLYVMQKRLKRML